MTEDNASAEYQSVAVAVHYVIAKTSRGQLGHVKLNRILWLSDLEHYRRHGVSMTGLRSYSRTLQGPMSKEIIRAVGDLVREGKVAERTVKTTGYARREMTSLAEPDFARLTLEQTEILDTIIDLVAWLPASQLSQITRDDPLWKELRNRDDMLVATGSVMARWPPRHRTAAK